MRTPGVCARAHLPSRRTRRRLTLLRVLAQERSRILRDLLSSLRASPPPRARAPILGFGGPASALAVGVGPSSPSPAKPRSVARPRAQARAPLLCARSFGPVRMLIAALHREPIGRGRARCYFRPTGSRTTRHSPLAAHTTPCRVASPRTLLCRVYRWAYATRSQHPRMSPPQAPGPAHLVSCPRASAMLVSF